MKFKFSILILLLLLSGFSFAQEVSRIHFEQAEQKILVYYNLDGSSNHYDIEVFCKYSEDYSWGRPLKFVSGDVGRKQKPGENMIIWDVLKERDELTGKIEFMIEVKPFVKIYKSSFLPVVIPGARLNHYPGGKTKGTVKAVAFYGLVGSSVLFKLASNRQYELYHQATTQEDMNRYYDKANNYYQAFQITLYSGIAIYALDFVVQAVRDFKPTKNNVALDYDPTFNSMNLTYIHKF